MLMQSYLKNDNRWFSPSQGYGIAGACKDVS